MIQVVKADGLDISYSVIRSKRKTLGIEVRLDGTVLARIPDRGVSLDVTREFVLKKADWIVKSQKSMKQRVEDSRVIDWQVQKKSTYLWIKGTGGILFRQKIDYWAVTMGLEFNKVRIKDASTRWGSCSIKKNLNFNWRLFLMPEELVDYVIVHELAHLRQMNHSKEFWSIVEVYIPNYKDIKKQLRRFV